MTNVQSSSDAQGLLIRASAGTGKTFRLTNRYLKLLVDGVEPHDILALTFTRKAAGEIFERVLKRLADHYERFAEVRSKVTSALVYPAFVLTVGIAMGLFFMLFMMPRLCNS